MGEQTEEKKSGKPKKHICIGLLAHVDAGKTTLSEAMLYLGGIIRECGRVDKKNAFLDNFDLERERGITIFSKQAVFEMGDMQVTLLDTPGHVDFSAEMERTLQVLDYAVLVINGADGVQSHTRTLWRLLARYQIPVFLFINKMDQFPPKEQEAEKARLLADVKEKLDDACVDFDEKQEKTLFYENLAVCDEKVLEQYLEEGGISQADIAQMISRRRVFPCYFGSALKNTGVEVLLRGMEQYMECPAYPETFGAKVYKIARDAAGNRLTYMKITGGSLKVKTVLTNRNQCGQEEEVWEEKADQIRIYSGARYESVPEAAAGMVCAVTGLGKTYAGQGLGMETASEMPVLEPVLSYQVQIPEDCDPHQMLQKLRQLEEEEPELHIVWDEKLGEIHAKLMGEVQTEILRSMVKERFGIPIRFGAGSIVYNETIAKPVEGIGHFEPLRLYAEVHLLLEPLEAGSGLVFDADCSEDVLDRNWQRLILTHLEEKEHIGVLTGSAVTDLKITLVNGRAHLKHTEGGDFRQATYRAVRQGLKRAQSVLLEPYYEFRLEIPSVNVGRAMTDIQKMCGNFEQPGIDGETAVITGRAPVVTMRDYQTEVISYTKGLGRLSCTFGGYAPCHNAAEVIEQTGYDSERDLENPTGSVFCAHGAGFVVPWDQVPAYMHLEELEVDTDAEDTDTFQYGNPKYGNVRYQSADYGGVSAAEKQEERPLSAAEYKKRQSDYWAGEKELEDIFTRTYGSVKRELPVTRKTVTAPQREPYYVSAGKKKHDQEYLLVDGYNIIFAWEELKALAEINIDSARDRLKDILCNYQGYKKCTLILVFDAYRVQGHREEISRYHNIFVVYTKEAETADMFIEKTVHAIGKKYQVTVATSDGLEQVIILGQGGRRMSAQGLKEEITLAEAQMREHCDVKKQGGRNYLGEYMPKEAKEGIADAAETAEPGKRKEKKG